MVSVEEPREWEILIWWSDACGDDPTLVLDKDSKGLASLSWATAAAASFDLGGVRICPWTSSVSPVTSPIFNLTISSARSQPADSESTSWPFVLKRQRCPDPGARSAALLSVRVGILDEYDFCRPAEVVLRNAVKCAEVVSLGGESCQF